MSEDKKKHHKLLICWTYTIANRYSNSQPPKRIQLYLKKKKETNPHNHTYQRVFSHIYAHTKGCLRKFPCFQRLTHPLTNDATDSREEGYSCYVCEHQAPRNTHSRTVVVKSWLRPSPRPLIPLRPSSWLVARRPIPPGPGVCVWMEGYNFSPEKLTSGKLKTFENFTLRAETLHTLAYTQKIWGGEMVAREKVDFLRYYWVGWRLVLTWWKYDPLLKSGSLKSGWMRESAPQGVGECEKYRFSRLSLKNGVKVGLLRRGADDASRVK